MVKRTPSTTLTRQIAVTAFCILLSAFFLTLIFFSKLNTQTRHFVTRYSSRIMGLCFLTILLLSHLVTDPLSANQHGIPELVNLLQII